MRKNRTVTALVPWYGGNRTLAGHVAAALDGCAWVGVPFAGGMPELLHIRARTIVVADLHRHVIALAGVCAHPDLGPKLVRRLRRWVFHPDALCAAQERCRERERNGYEEVDPDSEEAAGRLLQWAEDYFVCAWMARNGKAGTRDEFEAGLSVRWEAGGGDSALRFRHAIDALRHWRHVFPRCTFQVMDVFDFLDRMHDDPEVGVYFDAPFPGAGDEYKHRFTGEQHRQLAKRLAAFQHCRLVCRFYRHPLIEELYPADLWEWRELEGGRRQTNTPGPEVLLVKGGAA